MFSSDAEPSRRALLRAGIVATAAVPAASAPLADMPKTDISRSSGEISLMDLAPASEWTAIRTGRSTHSLSRAIAAASATGLTIIVPPGVFHLGESCALPSPIRFVGGTLDIASGATISFKSAVIAPAVPIFFNATQGLGTVHLNPATNVLGYAEWWGAKANSPDFDSQPAIQAAVDALPIVQLCAADYHVGQTIKLLHNGTVLRGVSATQSDEGPAPRCTRLIVMNPKAAGVQIGADSTTQPSLLTEYVRLEDFTVSRSGAIESPASGVMPASVGVAMRWCVNCHVSRIETLDQAVGFLFYGTIENYVRNCSSVRTRDGANPANDVFVGFYLDYSAPLAANGGNASLYFDHCRAFGPQSRKPTYSAGMASRDGFVDLYINAFECGVVQHGIDLNGQNYDAGKSFRTEDLLISQCVLDSCAQSGIRIRTGDITTAICISGTYVAPLQAGVAIDLEKIGGSVALTGNQYMSDNLGAGLKATDVNGLSSVNNIYSAPPQPIHLERVTNFRLQDTIHMLAGGNALPAVSLIDCNTGKVDCIINGPGGCCSSGVSLSGAATSGIEVACTSIQPSAPATGAANKLLFDGTQIIAAGPFGRNCLAQGLMS